MKKQSEKSLLDRPSDQPNAVDYVSAIKAQDRLTAEVCRLRSQIVELRAKLALKSAENRALSRAFNIWRPLRHWIGRLFGRPGDGVE